MKPRFLGLFGRWFFSQPGLPVGLLLGICLGCGRSSPPAPASVSAPASSSATVSARAPGEAEPIDPIEADLWARAAEGEASELARLADRIGCATLVERAAESTRTLTAIRAAAFCNDFGALGWLATKAAAEDEQLASAALESIVELAARPRQSMHRESPSETQEACASLLSTAKNTKFLKSRRIAAVNALRMIAADPFFPNACVDSREIPGDLDAH